MCGSSKSAPPPPPGARCRDRKSTRLNSSHQIISYAVFCLKKKKKSHSYRLQVITYVSVSFENNSCSIRTLNSNERASVATVSETFASIGTVGCSHAERDIA